MTQLPSLSVFFPCYNEQTNVPLFVAEALKILPTLAKKFEIIIINDGSQDDTKKVAAALAATDSRIRVINHDKNRGYGMALRSGFAAARYEWTFFTDGDLQFQLADLKQFLPFTEKHHIVIGYRQKRADGGLRAFNANLFKLYINLLFRVHVTDIDCAFKLLHTKTIQSVPLESTGAFINAELLYKLKKRGEVFKQIPVNHLPRKFGQPTGNNPKVIVRAGWEALKLYLHMKANLVFHHTL
jgi:glycosyltransferase involved in cell wall biosynthesis